MRQIKVRRFEDYLKNGDVRYKAELWHEGLHEHKVLSDKDDWILENKIDALTDKWNKKWSAYSEKLRKQQQLADLKEKAQRITEEAQDKIKGIENTLKHTLAIDDAIDWDSLKNRKKFEEPKPKKPVKEEFEMPSKENVKYVVNYNLWDKILPKRKARKEDEKAELYLSDYEEWKRKSEVLQTEWDALMEEHRIKVLRWEEERGEYEERRKQSNERVDNLKNKYFGKHKDSIIEYCDIVLMNSDYPSEFPQSFDLDYVPENQSLIVDYNLPALDSMPRLKEAIFIASRNEIKESFLSETQISRLYDSLIYQIVLRSVHEIYEADKADAISLVTFNGWVIFVSPATGKQETACIVSIQTTKEEFLEIDLKHVDPKACFKSLKGVGSSKLHGMVSIRPILTIDRSDSRIADHYHVAHELDDSVNLAMMNWEDFEHLIRELFEKEFVGGGGEVKVTRASRDGGVDAIAYDPDPIRGGKIVIQAKRYSNTVGVAAVRDLYGTVVNEGANKGILVTTSDYGPDAYNFAKNKPLTLLNGGNLLYLLEKHGHRAKIDLKEAKDSLQGR